jgi:small subunit ribosomal protein S4
MGDPRKLRKKYTPPKHPWEAERLAEERKLMDSFGLKNKKEVWRANFMIGRFRYLARRLVGIPPNQRKGEEEKLLGKLQKLGLLKEGGTLDDALSLKTEDLLARRLQTLVWKKGMASTLSQARQLITHGHIAINKRRVDTPGTIVSVDKEQAIDWYGEPVKIAVKKAEEKPPEVEKEKPKEEPKKEKPKVKKIPKPKKKVAEKEEIEEELEEDIPEVGEDLNEG